MFHERTQTPYIFDSVRKRFLTYDSPKSLGAKVAYAVEKGFGGVMVWALDQDDSADTLLNVVWKGACGNKVVSHLQREKRSVDEKRSSETVHYKCSPIKGKRWWTWDEDPASTTFV